MLVGGWSACFQSGAPQTFSILKASFGEPEEKSGLWPCFPWRSLIMTLWDGQLKSFSVLARIGNKVDQKA